MFLYFSALRGLLSLPRFGFKQKASSTFPLLNHSLGLMSHPRNLKLADVSLFRIKNNANQVALATIFLIIFHLFDLLKRLPVSHLEFKEKGSPPDLQRQVNPALVAHILSDDVHPEADKKGKEYAGIKALVTINLIVCVVIIGDTRKRCRITGSNLFTSPVSIKSSNSS